MWEAISISTVDSSVVQDVGALLTPKATSHIFMRVGSEHDGGYVLASDVPIGWVLSLGVGSDNRADLALAESGLMVFEFDHTVEGPPFPHANIEFNKVGLGESRDGSLLPIDKLVDLCHSRGGNGALLIDVEGAEWGMLEHQLPGSPTRVIDLFGQICIELHDLDQILSPDARAIQALKNLVANHVPVASHINNYGPCLSVAGRLLPTVLEISLVRSDLFHAGESHVPSHLFSPNNPQGPAVDAVPFVAVR